MKRRLFSLVFMLFLVSALAKVPVFGQASQPPAQSTTPGDRFLSPTVVSLSDGTIVYGLLIGMEGDSLVVRVAKEIQHIPLDTITRIQIHMEKDKNSIILSGLLLGAYLGNVYFFGTSPTFFRRPGFSLLADIALTGASAGAGIGLGYFVSSLGLRTKHLFDLSKSGVEKYAEWERLKKFVMGVDSTTSRFRICVQASHVFFRASDYSQSVMKSTGYDIYPDYFSGDGNSAGSKINLLRSIRLSFSLNQALKIGMAAFFVGEPRWDAYQWNASASYDISQKLSGTGYYATAEFAPLASILPKGFSLDIGAGLGAARIDFEFQTDVYAGYPKYDYQQSDRSFRRWFASGVVFTTLGLDLTQSLMLGLTADYVWVPSREISGVPEAHIPAQKIRLGNSSAGVVLGWHF